MIHLSQIGYHSLNAVLCIAKNNTLIKIRDISIETGISESLLRRIIADLEKWWILETVRWRIGGVRLAKDIHEISLYAVLESVWEELAIRDCTKWIMCKNKNDCQITDVFSSLQKGFNSLLKMHTLDKIIK